VKSVVVGGCRRVANARRLLVFRSVKENTGDKRDEQYFLLYFVYFIALSFFDSDGVMRITLISSRDSVCFYSDRQTSELSGVRTRRCDSTRAKNNKASRAHPPM
jgi:hypothetical protein